MGHLTVEKEYPCTVQTFSSSPSFSNIMSSTYLITGVMWLPGLQRQIDTILFFLDTYTFNKLVGCLCVNIETLLAARAPRALLARPLQRGGHGRRPRLGREVEPLLAAAAARRAVIPVLHLLGQQGEHLATRGGDLVGNIAQRARIPSYLAPVNRL